MLKFVCAPACVSLWHALNKQRESDSGRVTEVGRMGRREARRKEGGGGMEGERKRSREGGREKGRARGREEKSTNKGRRERECMRESALEVCVCRQNVCL